MRLAERVTPEFRLRRGGAIELGPLNGRIGFVQFIGPIGPIWLIGRLCGAKRPTREAHLFLLTRDRALHPATGFLLPEDASALFVPPEE